MCRHSSYPNPVSLVSLPEPPFPVSITSTLASSGAPQLPPLAQVPSLAEEEIKKSEPSDVISRPESLELEKKSQVAETSTDLKGVDFAGWDLLSSLETPAPLYELRALKTEGEADSSYSELEFWKTPEEKEESVVVTSALSTEQIQAALDYFLLCSNRVRQMSRTYHDIDAVTSLLDEKEKDLELAAQIGKSLLDRNRELQQRNEFLEEQLSTTSESVTQLKHELSQKIDLLHIFSESELDSSQHSTPGYHDAGSSTLEQKIALLEGENSTLRMEHSHLKSLTLSLEEKEEQLVTDCVRQLEGASRKYYDVHKELVEKSEECAALQTESRKYLKELCDQQNVTRTLTLQNEDLAIQLQAAQETQCELSQEILELQDRYAEVMAILHEAQEELRAYRKTPASLIRSGSPLADSLYDSLASELEASDSGFYTTPNISARMTDEELGEHWKKRVPAHFSEKLCEELRKSMHFDAIPEDPLTPPPGAEFSIPDNQSCSTPDKQSFSTPDKRNSVTPVPSNKEDSPRPSSEGSPPEMSELRGLSHAPSTDSLASYAGPGLGEPGLPGTRDLEYCVRRLNLRRKVELDYMKFKRERGYAKTGAVAPSAQTIGGASSAHNNVIHTVPAEPSERSYFVKQLESSVLVNRWRDMASSDRFSSLDSSSGVRTKLPPVSNISETELSTAQAKDPPPTTLSNPVQTEPSPRSASKRGNNTSIVWTGGKALMWPSTKIPSKANVRHPVGINVIFEEDAQLEGNLDGGGIFTRAAFLTAPSAGVDEDID